MGRPLPEQILYRSAIRKTGVRPITQASLQQIDAAGHHRRLAGDWNLLSRLQLHVLNELILLFIETFIMIAEQTFKKIKSKQFVSMVNDPGRYFQRFEQKGREGLEATIQGDVELKTSESFSVIFNNLYLILIKQHGFSEVDKQFYLIQLLKLFVL